MWFFIKFEMANPIWRKLKKKTFFPLQLKNPQLLHMAALMVVVCECEYNTILSTSWEGKCCIAPDEQLPASANSVWMCVCENGWIWQQNRKAPNISLYAVITLMCVICVHCVFPIGSDFVLDMLLPFFLKSSLVNTEFNWWGFWHLAKKTLPLINLWGESHLLNVAGGMSKSCPWQVVWLKHQTHHPDEVIHETYSIVKLVISIYLRVQPLQ